MKEKIKFLNTVLKGEYPKLILLIIITITYVILNLLQPLVFAFFIDNIVNLEPIEGIFQNLLVNVLGGVNFIRENLWSGALVVLFIGSLAAVAVFIRSRLNGLISENVAYNIKNEMFDDLMHLPYSYYVKSSSGDLIQRSTSDIDIVRRLFASQISEFIYALSIVLISFIIMLQRNLKLSLVAGALLPVIFIFAIIFFRYVQKVFLDYEHKESDLTAYISENLKATRVVKAFSRELYESEMFKEKNRKLSDAGKKVIDALGFYWGVSDFICLFSILSVLTYGVVMVRSDLITIGDVFLFVSYTGMMVWPLRHMGRIIADMSKVSVGLDRIIEIVNEDKEDLLSGSVADIRGDISLENVVFSYEDDQNNKILNDLSLSIKEGENIAIIGPTGSGKSSLIHLLLGLYDYESGSIKINGLELKDISKKHLRNNISVVLQEPFLFSRSIKENIMISRSDAKMSDLDHVLNIAHVDEFLNNFELGYDTVVGEKGATLSGGQRQRVAIARTIINDYPIIIFDDSLSAVDTETDANIREKLKTIKPDTTTIIITQRIASAKDADKIFVLENGKITQSGKHEDLIKEAGLYKRVYDIQNSEVGDLNGW